MTTQPQIDTKPILHYNLDMLKKNKATTKYITEEYLDKRFAQQTKTILEAVDFSLHKYSKKTDKQFNDLTKELYAVRSELKTEIKETRDELKSDINNVQTLIDGYVKAQEDFKQEFVIMKEEIRQIKKVFKQKLGVEIRAF